MMPGTRNMGLICPQKSLLSCGQKDLLRRGRCKRGLEEGDIPRLNNSCPRLPVLLAASSYPHQLSKSWVPVSILPHSYSSCVLIPYNICKSQASPAHLPRAAIIPSALSPETSSRDLGRRSLYESDSLPTFLCSPSCLILSIFHFYSKISNSLSVAQKPSTAYHQLKVCVLELAFQMSSHLSPAPPTSVSSRDPVSVE